jgi:hypothetical protein
MIVDEERPVDEDQDVHPTLIGSDEKPRDERIVRIALIGSVLVHLLLVLFYIGSIGLLEKLHIVFPHPKMKPEETVAVSSSLTIEKRTKPKPAPPPARTLVAPVQPRQAAPESAPVPQQVVQQPAAAAVPVPAKQHHELAKPLPTAPPEPPKSVKAEQNSETPTAPPSKATPSPIKAPKRVAVAEGQGSSEQRQRPRHSKSASHLSDEQLAQIQADLSQTISHARSNENPLSVPHPQSPAAPRHYNFSMTGVPGDMRSAQGLCNPIKGWTSGPWDYYYMSCNVAISDGTSRIEPVPWPVRWPANHDPYTGTWHMPRETPLQGPLPGWTLPAGTPISPELLQYARSTGAQI